MEAVQAPARVTVGGKTNDTAILYCGTGEVTVQADGHCVTLQQGQSLLAQATEETGLTVSGEGKLILTEAWY